MNIWIRKRYYTEDFGRFKKRENIMTKEVKLRDIYKNKQNNEYIKNRCNININEEIILKNADIVVHKCSDYIDIYVKKDDQNQHIIDNLEKYKCMRLPLSTVYLVPIEDRIFQRIIMVC